MPPTELVPEPDATATAEAEAAAAAAATAAAEAAAAAAAGAEGERPDWIPEAAWDPEAKAPRLDVLGEHVSTIGRDADVPEAVEGYTAPAIEGVTAEQLTADPAYKAMAKVAHAQGIGQEKFAAAVSEYVADQQAGETASRTEELGKLGTDAPARLQGIANFLGARLAKPQVDVLRGLITSAPAVEAFEALMGAKVGTGPRTPPPPAATRKTKEEISKLMDSPQYLDPAQRDPAIVKEVADWFAAEEATVKK